MLHKIIKLTLTFTLILIISLFALGCDQSNSDAYGWEDDATATPSTGDEMNATSNGSRPPRPTPYRPAPTPEPTPEPSSTTDTEPTPTPTPHVHNWEPYFQENRRKVRRTVEEVIYSCGLCGLETDNQRDADSHANTLHTNLPAHIISAGTVWNSTTVTNYRCNDCQLTFPTVAKWQAHSTDGKHWYKEETINRTIKCTACGNPFEDYDLALAHLPSPDIDSGTVSCTENDIKEFFDPAVKCENEDCIDIFFTTDAELDMHMLDRTPTCTSYSPITISEPVSETVYRCSCGHIFYAKSKAERHVIDGPGNPPYPYAIERRTVEKEVEIVEKTPTDKMVCTVCGEKRDA